MANAYNRALEKILTNDSPATPTTRSKAEIEACISEISERLKGPLSNVERLWLVEDRHEFQKQLTAMQ